MKWRCTTTVHALPCLHMTSELCDDHLLCIISDLFGFDIINSIGKKNCRKRSVKASIE